MQSWFENQVTVDARNSIHHMHLNDGGYITDTNFCTKAYHRKATE